MGATFSYLGYASRQQPQPRFHAQIPQQIHYHSLVGPTLILGNGDATSPSSIDLYTRLAALEKDLEISRTGNVDKEAVIQHLLKSSVNNARVKEITVKIKEQLRDLKTTHDQLKKENEEIKAKLRRAEDTIFALSTPTVPNSKFQSISTSLTSRSGFRPKSEPVTEDLIDLLDCSQASDSTKLVEEDSTLLDDFCEDDSEIEGFFKNTTPDESLHHSFDSETIESSYIVRFANTDEDAIPQDTIKVSTEKVQVPHSSSDSVAPLPEFDTNFVAFTESGDRSPDSNSPSRLISTSTVFNSWANGPSAPNIASTNFLEKASSQLASLASKRDEDESLDGPIATLPNISTREQAGPSISASTKLQSLPEKVKGSEIEPRWSLSKTFISNQARESAASLNRRNGGPGELQYADLFKYGIRFNPADSERDVYRTIVVSNISPAISLGTLLNHVRGGLVIDAKLLDTVKIIGNNSALITFLHEHAAMAFECYANQNSFTIGGIPAQARVVPTPTWPIGIPLRKAIFDHHHTRCLEVYNFPWQVPAHRLRNDLAVCKEMEFDRITHMQKRTDGILELHFSSVDCASHAYRVLSCFFSVYRDCTPYFTKDPCDQLLESLNGQHIAYTAEMGIVTKDSATPDPESATVDQSGRLSKVEWESDPELCRGRGFAMGSR